VLLAAGFWLAMVPPALAFPLFFVWTSTIFFMNGLTIGNLNALALQPLGHLAGLAASIVTAVSTVVSALLSIPVALAFDGTPRSLLTGVALFSVTAWWLMLGTRETAPAAA
jgi:DHA1 family bicyclomycin/chloramphenicol resistance-like MFS transporter